MNETVNNTGGWVWYRDVMRSWMEHPGQDPDGVNTTGLNMDQAYMFGVSELDVGVYSVSDDCFRVSSFISLKILYLLFSHHSTSTSFD